MSVFHYVAHQLRDVPLFESEDVYSNSTSSGAIYNDFDHNPLDLLQGSTTQEFCFSQCSNDVSHSEAPAVPQAAIDHAILEADKNEGILYDHLTFDSSSFDCSSDINDLEYMRKVYLLATADSEAWKKLSITDETIHIFKIRHRADWKGTDSVYDAWLLSEKEMRSSFDYDKFFQLYPDYEDSRKRIHEELHEGSEKENDVACGSLTPMSEIYEEDFEQPESNKVSKKYLTEKQVADFFSSPVLSKKDDKSNIRKPFHSKKIGETVLITDSSNTDGNETDDDKDALQSRLEWFHSKNIVETIVISSDEE